jgi:hypothetical protein
VREQFRRNSVALTSLMIALAALAYNTWRNETTEEHRNVRHAAFRVLETLGELQQIVDARYYYFPLQADRRYEAELRLRGFGGAAMARDLMNLMPPPAPAAGRQLHASWLEHFNALDDLDAEGRHAEQARQAEATLRETLVRSRAAVIQVLEMLD